MNAIYAYGSFGLPEEKSEIEIVEDPVKVLVSSYKLFEKLTDKIIQDRRSLGYWDVHWESKELVYQEALKALRGKENIKINNKDIKDFVRKNPAVVFDKRFGLFLSALCNVSSNDILFFEQCFGVTTNLGYKLKQSKKVIIGDGFFDNIGDYCEGYVVNFSHTSHASYGSENGLLINYGNIAYTGWHSKNLLLINYETVFQAPYKNENTIIINFGYLPKFWGDYEKLTIDLSQKSEPVLEKKLREIEFIKEFKNMNSSTHPCYEMFVEKLRQFDLKKFRAEVVDIADRILKNNG